MNGSSKPRRKMNFTKQREEGSMLAGKFTDIPPVVTLLQLLSPQGGKEEKKARTTRAEKERLRVRHICQTIPEYVAARVRKYITRFQIRATHTTFTSRQCKGSWGVNDGVWNYTRDRWAFFDRPYGSNIGSRAVWVLRTWYRDVLCGRGDLPVVNSRKKTSFFSDLIFTLN